MKREIYFAGGCFWGIEEYFSRINGVVETIVGYANSKELKDKVTYEEVCSGITGAVETVKVIYESDIITLEELLEFFFKVIDPTTLNRQGNDIGTQYRTGVYYFNTEDKDVILKFFNKVKNNYENEIKTECLEISNFNIAEGYHQKYLKKNPNGYCHIEFN